MTIVQEREAQVWDATVCQFARISPGRQQKGGKSTPLNPMLRAPILLSDPHGAANMYSS